MKLTFEELIEEIREIANDDVKKMDNMHVEMLNDYIVDALVISRDENHEPLRLHDILDAIWSAVLTEYYDRI